MHAGGKAIDKIRIGLKHQRYQRFLSLGGESLLGVAIERVPGPVVIRCQGLGTGDDPVKILPKGKDSCRLPFVLDIPVISVAGGAAGQVAEALQLGLAGGGDGTNARQRRLTGTDPAVDKLRMIDQERGHAEAG